MKDIWEMFRVILEERKKREIDPTIRVLGECVAEASKAGPPEAYARQRINEMLEFIAGMDMLFQEFQHLPPTAARGLIKLRGRVKKLLPG